MDLESCLVCVLRSDVLEFIVLVFVKIFVWLLVDVFFFLLIGIFGKFGLVVKLFDIVM